MRTWLLSILGVALLAGCGQDQLPSERENDGILNPNAVECRKSLSTGCLQGEIPSAPDLFVADKKFFDVNELANRFTELLPTIEDKDGTALTADEFEFAWVSKVDNDSFADGFHAYLKGAAARDEKVMKNGRFAVHKLPAGDYDVRVQKEFKFSLTRVADQPDALDTEGEEEPATDETVKPEEPAATLYCATLYAEDTVEIREGYRTGSVVFDHFNVTLTKCGEQETQKTSITLE